jgi:hypothetical protein
LVCDLRHRPRYVQALHGLAAELSAKGSTAAAAAQQASAMLYGELQRQANMLAFLDVFRILGVVCRGMIPLMLLIKSAPRGEVSALSGDNGYTGWNPPEPTSDPKGTTARTA